MERSHLGVLYKIRCIVAYCLVLPLLGFIICYTGIHYDTDWNNLTFYLLYIVIRTSLNKKRLHAITERLI